MRIKDFFNSDFKNFSNADNVRSIPSIIDGFKDSQRKAIYGMILHGNGEIKVSQIASQAALVTQYAHGEVSMAETIIGLAQNFPGSNNVNLLEPIGQFGSILSSESASPRYIYTKPSANLRKLIRTDDDCILTHRYEDGDKVEPFYFLPVLPIWALNGSVGIGTGHSVKILPRDPKNIATYIQRKVEGIAMQPRTIERLLAPTFNRWKGEVVPLGENKYELHGVIEVVNSTTLRVTELPVGYGVDKFKSILVGLIDAGKVRDYDNNSTESGFDFEIKVPREVARLGIDKLKDLFKLVARHTENITLWSVDGVLNQYPSVKEALDEFIDFRLKHYDTRRTTHIDILNKEVQFLDDKMLFIETWNKQDNIGKMSIDAISKLMIQSGVSESSLPRLLQLSVRSLTLDLIKELQAEIKEKEGRIKALLSSSAKDLYIQDMSTI